MGGWGNKTEKLGRVYAVTYDGRPRSRPGPRGKDSDPIEAQIKQLDHPSYNERRRAQTALIRQGKAALGPAVAALANPKTDPVAKRHLVWVLDAIAGGTPEASDAAHRRAEVARRRRPRPGRPRAGRARRADRRGAPCSTCSRIASPRSGSRP